MMIKFLMMILPIYGSTTNPCEDITPGMEGQIKEWLEKIDLHVCQRTVRSETTKDKAGTLPPVAYAVHHTVNESEERLRFPEENNVSSAIAVPQRVVSIQFVDEGDVTGVFEDHRYEQIDEYETTDSDDEESDFEEHSEPVNRACVKDPLTGED